MNYAALYSKSAISQTERLDSRQEKNHGGGYSFVLDIWARLDRFLILGSDAPTYYVSARKLTRDNAASVIECWSVDPQRTAARIVEISTSGRAPKESPALFALALGDAHERDDVRRAARGAAASVCRTASQLMELIASMKALNRGWGRGAKRMVSSWYESRNADDLGYQMAKYRARNGFDHSRLIKLSHPPAADDDARRRALYRWGIGKSSEDGILPDIVRGHEAAMAADTIGELVSIIERYRLTWEMVPTAALTDAKVWGALLPAMPLKALVRNLSTMSSVGLLGTMSNGTALVTDRLRNGEAVRRSRLHPYAILQALATYKSGHSVLGDRSWPVNGAIVDALNDAFYLAFANAEPSGKRHMLGIDISGSMDSSLIGGIISAREASAAMALVTASIEKAHAFVGFSRGITPLDISPRMRLDSVIAYLKQQEFDYTDCAAPMLHALDEQIPVDVFVVYTDNDTNGRSMHPVEALRRYRKRMGIDAKLIVVGMTSTKFSIADPGDRGMLDVVGFDSRAVSVMADFVRG